MPIETAAYEFDRQRLVTHHMKETRQNFYYVPEKCPGCNGAGKVQHMVSNPNNPERKFDRGLKVCDACKGSGWKIKWKQANGGPGVIRFFCINSICPDRFIIDLNVEDVVKGLLGYHRAHHVDYINYRPDRECPFCHGHLRPMHVVRFWKWDGAKGQWVDFFANADLRHERTIRRI
jgi:hypothetical protein